MPIGAEMHLVRKAGRTLKLEYLFAGCHPKKRNFSACPAQRVTIKVRRKGGLFTRIDARRFPRALLGYICERQGGDGFIPQFDGRTNRCGRGNRGETSAFAPRHTGQALRARLGQLGLPQLFFGPACSVARLLGITLGPQRLQNRRDGKPDDD